MIRLGDEGGEERETDVLPAKRSGRDRDLSATATWGFRQESYSARRANERGLSREKRKGEGGEASEGMKAGCLALKCTKFGRKCDLGRRRKEGWDGRIDGRRSGVYCSVGLE